MTELSYHWSGERFLESNDSSSRVIAAVWLVLYLALVAMAINTPGLSSTMEITAALSR